MLIAVILCKCICSQRLGLGALTALASDNSNPICHTIGKDGTLIYLSKGNILYCPFITLIFVSLSFIFKRRKIITLNSVQILLVVNGGGEGAIVRDLGHV